MKSFLILFAFLFGCSNQNFKNRTIENYYQSSGVEKYFLTDLPHWANFSSEANCKRNYSIRFFDIEQIMKSFSIDFQTAIQIQATFNDDYNRLFENYKDKTIPLNDEQLLFFKSSEKVNSKINFFIPPKYKRIHLVWIDEMIKNNEDEKKLKTFLKSRVHDEGVPVLVSMCLTKKELEEKFKEENFSSITSEMMSIYSSDGSIKNLLHFELDQFFTKDQQLYFYSKSKSNNNLFSGNIKFINY